MPASPVLSRPQRGPGTRCPQTGSFPPVPLSCLPLRLLPSPLPAGARSLRTGLSPRCPRCLERRPAHACSVGIPGLRTGPQPGRGAVPPRLWGTVESAHVSAGPDRQRGPWHPFTTRASWDLCLKGSGQLSCPWHGADADKGMKQRGTRGAGLRPCRTRRKGHTAPDSHPGRMQTLLDWVSGRLGSPRVLCPCTPSHRPSGSGLHCRLPS